MSAAPLKRLNLLSAARARDLRALINAAPPTGRRRCFNHNPQTAAPLLPWESRWSDEDSSWIVYVPRIGSVAGNVALIRTNCRKSGTFSDWFLPDRRTTDLKATLWAALFEDDGFTPDSGPSSPSPGPGAEEEVRYILSLFLAPRDGSAPPPPAPEGSPVALFRLADVAEINPAPGRPNDPPARIVTPFVLGAVSLGSAAPAPAGDTPVPGPPKTVQTSADPARYALRSYFCRVKVSPAGAPVLEQMDPPVVAWEIPVETHIENHSGGVL